MSTTFYLRDASDNPHLPDLVMAGLTKCGLSLDGLTPVSDNQVRVYLQGRTCGACTPHLGVGNSYSAPGVRAPYKPRTKKVASA